MNNLITWRTFDDEEQASITNDDDNSKTYRILCYTFMFLSLVACGACIFLCTSSDQCLHLLKQLL